MEKEKGTGRNDVREKKEEIYVGGRDKGQREVAGPS
jgi:hypothetical protein